MWNYCLKGIIETKVNRLDLLLPGIRFIVERKGKKLIESPQGLFIDFGYTKHELDTEHILYLSKEDKYRELKLYIEGNC